jgi:hypothetical protein
MVVVCLNSKHLVNTRPRARPRARDAAPLEGGVSPSEVGVRVHGAGGGRISMPYRGAAALARRSRSSRSASLSDGAGEVREGTASPNSAKNFSRPAGAAVQSSRAGSSAGLRKAWGALAAMLAVSPASSRMGGRSRTHTSSVPSSTRKHSSKLCRCGGGPRPGESACRASRTARRSARLRAARCTCRPPPPGALGHGPRGARSPARACGRPPGGRSSDRRGFVVYTHL